MCADGVAFGSELLYPLVHHLSIAKRAEPAEEFARDLAHGRPGGIGVYLFHHRCDGAAAADGHTKVVDGVRVRGRAHVFQLGNDAVHPEGKAVVLRVGTGGNGSDGSHLENPGGAPSNVPGRDPCRRKRRVSRRERGVQSRGCGKVREQASRGSSGGNLATGEGNPSLSSMLMVSYYCWPFSSQLEFRATGAEH